MLQAWCDLRHNGGGRWLCAVVSRVYDFTTRRFSANKAARSEGTELPPT